MSHGHHWVHLLFAVSVREGSLDLPARLGMGAPGSWVLSLAAQCTPRRGEAGTAPAGARSGFLAVEHDVHGHVHVHVVHGAQGQATVGLGPGQGCLGPQVGPGAGLCGS